MAVVAARQVVVVALISMMLQFEAKLALVSVLCSSWHDVRRVNTGFVEFLEKTPVRIVW